MVAAGHHMTSRSDSGHTSTVSITIRARRARWNVMKSRFQCVLTHWKSGFTASGMCLPGGEAEVAAGQAAAAGTDLVRDLP